MSAQSFFDIPGGIHPAERKELSNRTPIQFPPLPGQLTLPLAQHIGTPAEPCVSVGQHVLKGQIIAEATTAVSAPVHAPTSGTVSFIGPQPYPHVSGMLAPAIVIDSDGLDEWAPLQPCTHFQQLPAAELLEKIRQAGVTGLGGAGFPTAVKLSSRPQQKIHTLIINGTECEPYITADDLLMRERTAELLSGIDILVHLIQPESVLIGIEDNKPEAAAAVRQLIGERPYQVVVFPTKYPSGGEKQLIQILTGREVPSGGLPAGIGVLCQNVGTAVAIHDAVILGRPLISRITTLTGEALLKPMNVECLIGTPARELLAFAGLEQSKLNRLIMGGPMMGFTLPSPDVPVIKTTNCLLASTSAELPAPPPAQPCIRCGDCAEVCPASLLPQQLHFFALGEQTEQLKAHQLFDCIECGACAYVCPSSIPLVQYYRAAKASIREQEQLQQKADYSKHRFELRQERLRLAEEQKEAERQARAERQAKARASQAESSSPARADDQLKRLKIEASMAQVALKKAEKQLAQHDTDELKAQVAQLQSVAAAAQQALQVEQAKTPAPELASAAVSSADDPLKRAKIEAAMLKAQLRKLEKVENPDAEQQIQLEQLRNQLSAAEAALADAPAPAAAADKPAVDPALKKAKIDLAVKRAELKKAEKAELPESQLQALREAVSAAETALHAAEAASPKPAPEHVLVNKSGLDDQQRALKTEVAFARADLRKLERDDSAAADALEVARKRLAEAERQFTDYQGQ